MRAYLLFVIVSLLAGGCHSSSTGEGAAPDGGGDPVNTTGDGAAGAPGGTVSGGLHCSDLFDPNKLQTYSIEISDDEWAKMDSEFRDVQAVLNYMPRQTYHPIMFHYGAETLTDAMIRLKGQSSWVDTVTFDGANAKMQFVIAFDQVDSHKRFHGIDKLTFDMPRSDWSFLNERLANTWLRQLGIMAPCSNSARLNINGQYYGVYVTEENKGNGLLKQFFPDNPDGDLFKAGREADTNKATPNWPRLQQLWDATDIAAVEKLVDIPSTLLEWAAEAVLNDSDGYYGGSHNFYLYDQGARGYVWVPTDVDSTIEWMAVFTALPYQQHPIYWWEGRPFPQPPGQHYLIILNDPQWRARYADAIATQAGKWNVGQMQGLLDAWSKQITDAVDADPHKWATSADFRMAVAAAHDVMARRPQYLRDFVACERGAGGADADGDGVAWCNDCRDDDATIHPGAPEVCGNGIDDNCNGVVDEGCPGEMPGYPGQPDGGAGDAAVTAGQ